MPFSRTFISSPLLNKLLWRRCWKFKLHNCDHKNHDNLFLLTFLTHFMPRSLSIPPGNIRNLWLFDVFRGYRKRPAVWNGLKVSPFSFPFIDNTFRNTDIKIMPDKSGSNWVFDLMINFNFKSHFRNLCRKVTQNVLSG